MNFKSISKAKGFTLIELMMVVAVIGIIVAIALPSYQNSTLKARRSDGQTKLLEVQANMERYIFDNTSYPANLSDMSAYSANTDLSDQEYYEVTIKSASGSCPLVSCYQLQATALGPQVDDGDLELHSNGTKVGNW